MGKINFAVWNIDRAAAKPDDRDHPGKKIRERAAGMRIGRLLEKTDLDFIFLQEVPDPNRIDILAPCGNEWKIPAPDSELKQVDCRCLHKDGLLQGVWIPHPDQVHHCSGVLFLRTEHGRKQNLTFREVKSITDDPVGMVCTIFHAGKPKDDILHFIGFWNSSKNGYLQHFLNFLDRSLERSDKEMLRRCVVAGDTNVNVRTEKEKPGEWTEDGKILAGHLSEDGKKIPGYLEKKGLPLVLIGGEADQYTHRWKRTGGWYRCDLLMASSEVRLQSVSCGREADYMWKGKPAGSDHLPLFFSFPYDD